MRVAQSLYENGFITYMRTDSTVLSSEALSAARSQAAELYGPQYVPDKPRLYANKSKNAQEAHEAIRPAGDRFRTPAQVSGQLRGDDFRLYELIWKRTVASQMADARGSTASVRLAATSSRRPGRRVQRQRHGDHLPRLPGRLRGGSRRGPRRRRRRRTPSAGCRSWPSATASRPASWTSRVTRRARRRATPRPAWSRRWRSAASAARRRTPRRSRPSWTAATCGPAARRWCRTGSRSR